MPLQEVSAPGIGRMPRREGGGGVDNSHEDERAHGVGIHRHHDDAGGGDIGEQQDHRDSLAGFEDAGDAARAMIGMPGIGPLGMALNAVTGTGWMGEYNPDFLTTKELREGQTHTGKAATIAEKHAGIAPPSYDDDENEENAREIMEQMGAPKDEASGGIEGYSGGSASDAQGTGGDTDVRKRGGEIGNAPKVDHRLAPSLPPIAAPAKAQEADGAAGKSGFLNSPVAGRTDQLRVTAPSGSYVIPADVVSGIGEGNSLAGARILQDMFQAKPGEKDPPPEAMRARGGGLPSPVPILAAGGEFVISPRDLARVFGSVAHAHKVLDAWVVDERKKIVKEMSKLPGPAKD